MKNWFYFYDLNGLMIRFLIEHKLLWISYGHRAEWQFSIARTMNWSWPKLEHKIKLWWIGPFQLSHFP